MTTTPITQSNEYLLTFLDKHFSNIYMQRDSYFHQTMIHATKCAKHNMKDTGFPNLDSTCHLKEEFAIY